MIKSWIIGTFNYNGLFSMEIYRNNFQHSICCPIQIFIKEKMERIRFEDFRGSSYQRHNLRLHSMILYIILSIINDKKFIDYLFPLHIENVQGFTWKHMEISLRFQFLFALQKRVEIISFSTFPHFFLPITLSLMRQIKIYTNIYFTKAIKTSFVTLALIITLI